MLNLFSSKARKKNNKDADNAKSASGGQPERETIKTTTGLNYAQIRVQKDIVDIEHSDALEVIHPDPNDLMNFQLIVRPNEGYYTGGVFEFQFSLKDDYPHSPPKVKCKTEIYHPNIDVEGNVCLNILREDWKPVLSLNAVILGVYHLFLEPNPEDPLNKEAGDALKYQPAQFASTVSKNITKVRFQQQRRPVGTWNTSRIRRD